MPRVQVIQHIVIVVVIAHVRVRLLYPQGYAPGGALRVWQNGCGWRQGRTRAAGSHHAARAHHPARPHHGTPRRPGMHRPSITVPAVIAARGPTKYDAREENHRNDENHTGSDEYPGSGLTKPAGPVVPISGMKVVRRAGAAPGLQFRFIRHDSNDGARLRLHGRDHRP